MKKVLFFGYYGEGNLGDELLLKNLIDKFSERFLVGALVSKKKETGNKIILFDRIRELLKAINWADVVIGGGGGIFQDKTSLHSFLYYLFILWYALLTKKKVYIIGQSFSTLKYRISRFLLKITLPHCGKIYVRDSFSYQFLQNLNVPKDKIKILPDIVFLTQFPDVRRDKENIGINFRPWYELKIEDLEKILKELLKENRKIIFFSFQDSMDLELFKKLDKEITKEIEVVSSNSDNFWEKFSTCKYLVGMRLHSLILSTIAGIPFLGISYDEKIQAYLDDLGWKYYINTNEISDFYPLWIKLKEEEEILRSYLKIVTEEKRDILKREIEEFIESL